VGQEPILFSGTVGDNIAYGIDSELRAKVEYLKDGDIRAQVVEAAKVILHRYLCYILWMVNGLKISWRTHMISLWSFQMDMTLMWYRFLHDMP